MITSWLEKFISWIPNLVNFLDTFYVFGTVSALDFLIVILLMSMVLNVWVARGST